MTDLTLNAWYLPTVLRSPRGHRAQPMQLVAHDRIDDTVNISVLDFGVRKVIEGVPADQLRRCEGPFASEAQALARRDEREAQAA